MQRASDAILEAALKLPEGGETPIGVPTIGIGAGRTVWVVA
jgi:hypothetical protein